MSRFRKLGEFMSAKSKSLSTLELRREIMRDRLETPTACVDENELDMFVRQRFIREPLLTDERANGIDKHLKSCLRCKTRHHHIVAEYVKAMNDITYSE